MKMAIIVIPNLLRNPPFDKLRVTKWCHGELS